MAALCERECAVTALAGAQVCALYGLPCWLCIVLHILTGTLRNVTEGRFYRFGGFTFFSLDVERSVLGSPALVCPHHPGASTIEYAQRHGPSYWYSTEPSLTSTPVTPARKVSDGTSQTEATEETACGLSAL